MTVIKTTLRGLVQVRDFLAEKRPLPLVVDAMYDPLHDRNHPHAPFVRGGELVARHRTRLTFCSLPRVADGAVVGSIHHHAGASGGRFHAGSATPGV